MEDLECEFLSRRQPLPLSQCFDATDFLLSPKDGVNNLAGSKFLEELRYGGFLEELSPGGYTIDITGLLDDDDAEDADANDDNEDDEDEDEDEDYCKENLFKKRLTTSDVGNLAYLLVAVAASNEDAKKYFCLATVLRGSDSFLQLEDEEGKLWRFSYFNVSEGYILTNDWSSYVEEKQLSAGDFVFFQRHLRDSSRLLITFRRRDKVGVALVERYNIWCPSPATSVAAPLGDWDDIRCSSPATSFVDDGSAPRDWDYLVPDTASTITSFDTVEEEIEEVETPLQPRLPDHSITGFDTILVISCGDNRDAEETYFISYIFSELCLRGFTPLRYDLTRSMVTGNQEMLYSSCGGIVIISKNYVCSRECLDGFLAIVDHLIGNNRLFIPVFFKASLSDFMDQSDSFGNSLQVQKWREAMFKLTSIINGYQYMKGHEVMLVKNIVRDVCLLLRFETNGIKLALESILPLLDCPQSSSPHIVGLWGMAGIGKTTISREIFRTQAERYDLCYFLPDFHLTCQTKELRHLRDEFFSKIFGEDRAFIDACDTKLSFIRNRLVDKRVLIVLDGVSNARDVEGLVGGFCWFSGGHTIIFTSRNRQVLVQCAVKELYKIPKLSKPESLHLCRKFATEQNWGLISELANYATGIPLALRSLGSSLQEQCINDEKEHMRRLRQHPPAEIQDAFRRSFDVLDDNEKNTFLDLACFFRGENKDHVVNILDGCGSFTDLAICGLIDESLISLVDNLIEMPNVFQDTGRFVVWQEDSEACKRSRLWDPNDIVDVLTNNLGTEVTEGIYLDASGLTFELSPTVFEKLYRLRLLKFHCSTSETHCKICLPRGLYSLPDELRLLHWERYLLPSLPRNFNPKNLVELNMPYSNMTKLWKGTKNLEKLKRIILSHSRQLTKVPRLSKAPNLEYIDLEGCTSLVKVNSSILHHRKLTFVSLKDCSQLRIMPTTVHLESLEVLNLSGCSELEDLQDFSPNLKELYLAGTAITEMPSSLGDLTRLVILDLKNCIRLQRLPPGISNLKSLITFKLSGTKLHAPPSMDLSSMEDMTPPYKRYRLKRVIESVILSLRKRRREKSVFRTTNQVQIGSDSISVKDFSYKSFWGLHVLPERPGQPECQYYMKTGDCESGNVCEFHHPRNTETHVPESTSSMAYETPDLNQLGLSPQLGASSSSDLVKASTEKLRIHKNTSTMVMETPHLNPVGLSLPFGVSSKKLAVLKRFSSSLRPSLWRTIKKPKIHKNTFSMSSEPLKVVPELSSSVGDSSSVPLKVVPGLSSSFGDSSSEPLEVLPGLSSSFGDSSSELVATLSAKRPASSMHLCSMEDMAQPYKRNRLKKVIETVIQTLRKRKREKNVSTASNLSEVQLGSAYTSFSGLKGLPERPGQPECQYYMKTGDCQRGIFCRFHHPKDRETNVPESSLNPSRPGKAVCAMYFRTGNCSFGPTCNFDHPSLVLTYKNTSSMASETGSTLQQKQFNMMTGQTKKPRIHQTSSSIASEISHLNLPRISYSFGASSNEPEEASASTVSGITQATMGKGTIDSKQDDENSEAFDLGWLES